MILIDTSLWVDHFRKSDPVIASLVENGNVLCHPFVIGEIMMGNPRNRNGIADLLGQLPQTQLASDMEVLDLVERHSLFGSGISYIDAHLLASVRLTLDAAIWTRDRRMEKAAEELTIFASDVPKLQ